MSRELSTNIENQITRQELRRTHTFTINNVDYTNYLISFSISTSREFGAGSATFDLLNNDGEFGDGGANQINVGDIVQLIQIFEGDSTQWKRFYGQVTNRSIVKDPNRRVITIACLDYVSTLPNLDIDLSVEGTKVKVENEILTPNFLPAPNDKLAQVFDFSRNGIATYPPPIVMIYDVTHSLENIQSDGYEINYDTGQLTLGAPINADTNYQVRMVQYHYYTVGAYAEDVLESILKAETGYSGKYIFGETSAQDVVDLHLTETYQNVEGAVDDSLIPNYLQSTITLTHQLSADVTAGATTITLDSTDGFAESGQGEINGDVFTWAGKTSTQLQNIPASGEYSLKAHTSGDYVKYESTYVPGSVWSLTYSNLVTNLVAGDFSGIPSGISVDYVDKRFGRIFLSAPVPTTTPIQCTNNYSFKTIQASGIEINSISFRSKDIENRFEAIQKLLNYVAPNYIIRTLGDNKIWASYLTQKSRVDYTLNVIGNLSYLEDDDLYTRVLLYAKNSNPTNVMFGQNVDFISTGQTFKSLASNNELNFGGEEGDYYVYGSLLTGVGYIDLEGITPVAYIDGVAIDNNVHELRSQPIVVELTTRTETRTGCHGVSKEQYFKSHTYYYYKVYFAHGSISPNAPIYIYNAVGEVLYTLSPNDPTVDYARGVWNVPGEEEIITLQTASNANYSILYGTNSLVIDYDNVLFKIKKDLIVDPAQTKVTATYEYWNTFTNAFDVAAIVDGRADTQVQTEFFAEPPSGFPLAILDLGQVFNIQALDIVAGFYQPNTNAKYDIDMRISIESSTDGISFFPISDKLSSVKLSGGQAEKFETDELGENFQARYLKLNVESAKKLDYGKGVWPVAFSELAAYDNIVIKSNATLIPATTLTQIATPSSGTQTIYVTSTAGFEVPESAEEHTAYIDGDLFTYTGVTATTFTGVTGFTESHLVGVRVHQTLEDDTTVYDDSGLLAQLGDRVYKKNIISDRNLFTQAQLDSLSKKFLQEFYKNHTKVRATVLYTPYIQIGHTVALTDTYNNKTATRYFVEGIEETSDGLYILTLARYPTIQDQVSELPDVSGSFVKTLVQSVTLADTCNKSITDVISNTLTLTDTVTNIRTSHSLLTTLIETLTLTDTDPKTDSITKTETATLTDTLTTVYTPGLSGGASTYTTALDFSFTPTTTYPIESGVLIPRGRLFNTDNLKLETIGGTEVDAQYRVVSSWPDGSIMSAGVVALRDNSVTSYSLRYGTDTTRSSYTGLSVVETGSDVTVDTTVISFRISKSAGYLFEYVKNGADTLVTNANIEISQYNGTTNPLYYSYNDTAPTVTVEEDGPVRAVIKHTGRVKTAGGAASFLTYVIRYYAYYNSDIIKLQVSLEDKQPGVRDEPSYIVGGNPANTSLKTRVYYYYLNLPYSLTGTQTYAFGTAGGGTASSTVSGEHYYLQLLHDNIVGWDFLPYTFETRGVQAGTGITDGKGQGWMDITNGTLGITSCIKEFWQRGPKELQLQSNNIRIGLHPKRASDEPAPNGNDPNRFDRPRIMYFPSTGGATTHEVVLSFHTASHRGSTLTTCLNNAPRFRQTAADYCASGALTSGRPIAVAGATTLGYDYHIKQLHARMFSDSVPNDYGWTSRLYGERDYGCQLFHSPNGDENSITYPKFWRGNQNDQHCSLSTLTMIEYLRTLDEEYFKYSNQMARHGADHDIRHCVTTGAIGNTDNTGVSGEPHTRFHADQKDHVQLEFNSTHGTDMGLPANYMLTGDYRIYDIMIEMGDWYASFCPYRYTTGDHTTTYVSPTTNKYWARDTERLFNWVMQPLMSCYRALPYKNLKPTWLSGIGMGGRFLLDWFRITGLGLYRNGTLLETPDYTAGTGCWLLWFNHDNASGSGQSNGGSCWMGGQLLATACDYFEFDKDYNTILSYGNTRYQFMDMLMQEAKHLTRWSYQWVTPRNWTYSASASYGAPSTFGITARPVGGGYYLNIVNGLLPALTYCRDLYENGDTIAGMHSNLSWFSTVASDWLDYSEAAFTELQTQITYGTNYNARSTDAGGTAAPYTGGTNPSGFYGYELLYLGHQYFFNIRSDYSPPSGTTPPTMTFTATDNSIALGGSSTLEWTVTDTTTLTASDGWTGSKTIPTSTQVVSPTTTTTYTLTATGTGGSITKSVTITVNLSASDPFYTTTFNNTLAPLDNVWNIGFASVDIPAQTTQKTAIETSNLSTGWTTAGSERYALAAPHWLEYQFTFTATDWSFSVTATNFNSTPPIIPSGYAFLVDVAVDGITKATISVPGSTSAYMTGTSIPVTMTAGTHTIRFTWTNDAYAQNQYDANIRVQSVSFNGPSTSSVSSYWSDRAVNASPTNVSVLFPGLRLNNYQESYLGYNFTAGRIHARNSTFNGQLVAINTGSIEAVIQAPYGKGMMSSFHLSSRVEGVNWTPASGEVGFQFWNNDNTKVNCYLISPFENTEFPVTIPSSGTYNGAAHTYKIEKDSTQIRWYIDGTLLRTRDLSASELDAGQGAGGTSVFNRLYYPVLSSQCGGNTGDLWQLSPHGPFDNSSVTFPNYLYVNEFSIWSTTVSPPTIIFDGNPTAITTGQSSTLTWSTTNATTVTASGDWSGTKATSGSQVVTPISDSTYTLTATGAGGNVQDSVAITVTPASTGSWNLVWSDEFNGAAGTMPNSTDWTVLNEQDWTGNANGGNTFFRNNSNNVSLDGNSNLVITMRNDSAVSGYTYSSGRMQTRHKKFWTYGAFEFRAKIPTGPGIWPGSVWMFGEAWTPQTDPPTVPPSATWPGIGEFDIAEWIEGTVGGSTTTVLQNMLHPQSAWGDGELHLVNVPSNISSNYHVYRMEWLSTGVKFFVDPVKDINGNVTSTPTVYIPRASWWNFNIDSWQNGIHYVGTTYDLPFFFDVVIQGRSGQSSSTYPKQLIVDYIRVYEAV